MMRLIFRLLPLLLLSLITSDLYSESIDEKLLSLQSFSKNSELSDYPKSKIEELQNKLKNLYFQVDLLSDEKASKEEYLDLLNQIKKARSLLEKEEIEWKRNNPSPLEEEAFSFLNEEESTLFNIILEYGCRNTLYMVPPDIRSIPIHLASQVPIPKESWDDVLSIILHENGIGIDPINPFVKRLYIMQDSFDGVRLFQNTPDLLDAIPTDKRIGYFLKIPENKIESVLNIVNKFYSPQKTSYYPLENSILIISNVSEIKKIIQLCNFITDEKDNFDFSIETTSKIPAHSLMEILNSYFENKHSSFSCLSVEGSQSLLFMRGSKNEIKQAKSIHKQIQNSISNHHEQTVYCYTTKHSDAKALSEILEKCYPLILEKRKQDKALQNLPISIYQNQGGSNNASHFIVDEKTDTLIMIVDSSSLPILLNLLKKIDIPKKMVQLEVLFFEKRIKESNNFGLNQLKIGKNAGQIGNGVSWAFDQGASSQAPMGIFDFFLSKGRHKGIPAYDLTYQFLISQEDIQINSCPTVTTINQTPAIVRLVDEISINTGVVAFGNTNDKNNYLKDSYAREEFGVVLEITPTINEGDQTHGKSTKSFITLKTNISFESNNSRPSNPRPDITKRKIENEVRIADGETIIVGGLRKKSSTIAKDSIPFFGSIPGIGKFFSHNEDSQGSTEMFICITPKIVESSLETNSEMKFQTLKLRPGDNEELISSLNEAFEYEAKLNLSSAFNTLLNKESIEPDGEYDGR